MRRLNLFVKAAGACVLAMAFPGRMARADITLLSDSFTLTASRTVGSTLGGSPVESDPALKWSSSDSGNYGPDWTFAGSASNGYVTNVASSFPHYRTDYVPYTIGQGVYTLSANMWGGSLSTSPTPWTVIGFFNGGYYPLYGQPLYLLLDASGDYGVYYEPASGGYDVTIIQGTISSSIVSTWSDTSAPAVSLTWNTLDDTVSAAVAGQSVLSDYSLSAVESLGPSTVTSVGISKDNNSDSTMIIDNFALTEGTAVPEPASLGLLAMGSIALLGRRRFKQIIR